MCRAGHWGRNSRCDGNFTNLEAFANGASICTLICTNRVCGGYWLILKHHCLTICNLWPVKTSLATSNATARWDAEENAVFQIMFLKVIEKENVVLRQSVQSFFLWECDMEWFSWIRAVGFAFQYCSEKFLSRTEPYHLYWPSSSCFSESSNCTQLALLCFSSPLGNQYFSFQWTELKLRKWSLLLLELKRQKMFGNFINLA